MNNNNNCVIFLARPGFWFGVVFCAIFRVVVLCRVLCHAFRVMCYRALCGVVCCVVFCDIFHVVCCFVSFFAYVLCFVSCFVSFSVSCVVSCFVPFIVSCVVLCRVVYFVTYSLMFLQNDYLHTLIKFKKNYLTSVIHLENRTTIINKNDDFYKFVIKIPRRTFL